MENKVVKPAKKVLYSWNWVGGGYNQTYAFTKKEALKYAKDMQKSGTPLIVDIKSVKRHNEKSAKEFWKNYPIFD